MENTGDCSVDCGNSYIFVRALSKLEAKAQDAHNQLLFSTRPSLSMTTFDDIDELPIGISIQNAGPGPARIKSVKYFVDGKPIVDLDKATNFEGLPEVHIIELEADDTLAVGENEWLLKDTRKPHEKDDEKAMDAFVDFVDHHLVIKVEFCPIVGDECGVQVFNEWLV
jgi:hypothetical protein